MNISRLMKVTAQIAAENVMEDISLDLILQKVAEASGIKESIILSNSKKREICDARSAYSIIAVNISQKSLTKIGQKIRRSHSNILHHVNTKNEIKNVTEIIEKTRLCR